MTRVTEVYSRSLIWIAYTAEAGGYDVPWQVAALHLWQAAVTFCNTCPWYIATSLRLCSRTKNRTCNRCTSKIVFRSLKL